MKTKKTTKPFPADHSIQYKRHFYKKFEVSLGNLLSKNLCKPPKKFRLTPIPKSLEKQSNRKEKNSFEIFEDDQSGIK